MPPRMIAFDTEAEREFDDTGERQTWKVGCAIRWRTDLSSGPNQEAAVFDTPERFWEWVSSYTKKSTRTVVWAHNLGYDVRISRMFEILPTLGFRLEWCNLDRNISSATWRSDHGSIVLADTWTWIPLPLEVIAGHVGMVKYDMPPDNAPYEDWASYCTQDCSILYAVCRELISFIRSEHLGNWQPTGAGMAMAAWRHRFMDSKVLVHDDIAALKAERMAMHTGRAEAWRHGKCYGEKWTEVDLRNAYVAIAANTEVPRKLHMHHRSISVSQYRRLSERFAVLCRVVVSTTVECVPTRIDNRHLWPIGTFETWLWDCELDLALENGATVDIRECYTYVRHAALANWASWVLSILHADDDTVSPVVRTHIKHCGRALIGRLAMRAPHWELWGDNITGQTGITYQVYPDTGSVHRMLHVGNDVLIEKSREESRNSMPMITGYIMSKCRVMLWEAMNAAGTENLAHVDTDSILVSAAGLGRLVEHYGNRFDELWQVKGTYTRLVVHGPRAYYRDGERKTSGIPMKATETAPGQFVGEQWSALASDLEAGRTGSVTIRAGHWALRTNDPRRADAPGGRGRTVPYLAGEVSSANKSSDAAAIVGL